MFKAQSKNDNAKVQELREKMEKLQAKVNQLSDSEREIYDGQFGDAARMMQLNQFK